MAFAASDIFPKGVTNVVARLLGSSTWICQKPFFGIWYCEHASLWKQGKNIIYRGQGVMVSVKRLIKWLRINTESNFTILLCGYYNCWDPLSGSINSLNHSNVGQLVQFLFKWLWGQLAPSSLAVEPLVQSGQSSDVVVLTVSLLLKKHLCTGRGNLPFWKVHSTALQSMASIFCF